MKYCLTKSTDDCIPKEKEYRSENLSRLIFSDASPYSKKTPAIRC